MEDQIYQRAVNLVRSEENALREKIANSTEEPTFKNTVEPLERLTWLSEYSEPFFLQAKKEFLTENNHFKALNEIPLDKIDETQIKTNLFKNLIKIKNKLDNISKNDKTLNQEERKLLEFHKNNLSNKIKPYEQYVDDINLGQQIVNIKMLTDEHLKFGNLFLVNIARSLNGYVRIPETEKELLIGIDSEVIAVAKENCQRDKNRGKFEGYYFSRLDVSELLVQSQSEVFREILWHATDLVCVKESPYVKSKHVMRMKSIGYQSTNLNYMIDIIKIRAILAEKHGYKSFAEWRLSTQVLNTPDKVLRFLISAWCEVKVQLEKHLTSIREELSVDDIKPYDIRHCQSKLKDKPSFSSIDNVDISRKVNSLTSEEAETFYWDDFESDFWKELDVPKCIQIPGLMSTQDHMFGHDLQACKLYSYLFDQCLAHDIFMKAKENGLFSEATKKGLVNNIYSIGCSDNPMEAIENFLGRKPNIIKFFKDEQWLPLKGSQKQKKDKRNLKFIKKAKILP